MAQKNDKVNVYSLKGDVVKTMELPEVFGTEFRPDIIRKAVVAEEANQRQPYGSKEGAGARHAVSTWGKGRGVARVQRLTQGAKAAESPNNVGGRRAFPPKAEKDWSKKCNRKERALARLSALAAASEPEMVKCRGHKFDEKVTLPVIVDDGMESLKSTSDVIAMLKSIGLQADVDKAKDGTKVRAGRGKMRSRKYRTPRSLLLVVSNEKADLFAGANNLPGVEVAYAEKLNAGNLAPGGLAGRLTVFSESAIKRVGEW
ncbi:MAG TPA: 50S ribosomal protein L4 [Methanomassiliicoccales archaeon]|nr:50S ribosomal protein L4 [Methanomassiliicoccales archaeon]